jgi:hypothetical protein
MINKIIIPGFYRISTIQNKDEQHVILQSLNGKEALFHILQSEVEMEENVIKDFDGQPSVGQRILLEMSETGKVKASRHEMGATPYQGADYQELGKEAFETIRRINLEKSGETIKLTGLDEGGLNDAIQRAGGRDALTLSLIKAVSKATSNLSLVEHIVWQYIKSDDAIHCFVHIPSSLERIGSFAENLFNPLFSTSTPHVFFKEYVGEKYKNGLCGRRVLVLGESLFCKYDGQGNHERCPFFGVCTDTSIKNSSAFDQKCPYEEDGPLSEVVVNNVKNFLLSPEGKGISSYLNFTDLMKAAGIVHGKEDLFERIVLYDFLQFYAPLRNIKPSFFSDRDDLAFEEIVRKHDPQLIIIWGVKVGDHIKAEGKFPAEDIQGADPDYIFRKKVAGRWRLFLCINHPSRRCNPWEAHVSQTKLVFHRTGPANASR